MSIIIIIMSFEPPESPLSPLIIIIGNSIDMELPDDDALVGALVVVAPAGIP